MSEDFGPHCNLDFKPCSIFGSAIYEDTTSLVIHHTQVMWFNYITLIIHIQSDDVLFTFTLTISYSYDNFKSFRFLCYWMDTDKGQAENEAQHGGRWSSSTLLWSSKDEGSALTGVNPNLSSFIFFDINENSLRFLQSSRLRQLRLHEWELLTSTVRDIQEERSNLSSFCREKTDGCTLVNL